MRKITKGTEPQSLANWKHDNPEGRYKDLPPEIRQDIRNACISEQHGLCAYCCERISGDNGGSHNEHVIAQSVDQNRTLDFSNIVASCENSDQCGKAHESSNLPLTPFMNACETELKFKLSGVVAGLSDRARQTIEILNLGDQYIKNRNLISKRKAMIDSLLFTKGVPPDDFVEPENAKLLELLIEELEQLDADNCLQSYAPVLINVCRDHLAA